MLTDFDKYEPKTPYPDKADFITTYYYSKGKVQAVRRPGEFPSFFGTNMIIEEAKLKQCVTEKVIDEEAFNAAMAAYRDERNQLTKQFEIDLYVDLGITRNKKRFDLYAKAWDRGHAYGFSEVYSVACDLVDLIKD